LWSGLPALLVGGVSLGLIGVVSSTPQHETRARYLDRAKSALAAKDYAVAMTCYDRLAGAEEGRPEVLYGLAVSAEALGQAQRAIAIMRRLAEPDASGYGPAHLWWALRLLGMSRVTPQVRTAARSHLLHAVESPSLEDLGTAHGLLGELYLTAGQLDPAERHLQQAAASRPYYRLKLAQVYAVRGDKARARNVGEQAVKYYRAWARSDPQSVEAKLSLAEGCVFLEDCAGAVAVLREAMSLHDNPAYRAALARAYLSWAEILGRDPKADPGRQLELLEEAARIDPANRDLLVRLGLFTKAKGPAAEKAREVLRRQLARGKGTALVHFVLGTDAWDRGQTEEALLHLEQAYRQAPELGLVANNLAWVLIHAKPPQHARALELMNSALKRWPKEPMFLDTRGQIYVRMGRWNEALTDLEKALSSFPNHAPLHKSLAQVYERLGKKELAAEHLRLAEPRK
jgi:tetratricopeptide (TPR) repeat protein